MNLSKRRFRILVLFNWCEGHSWKRLKFNMWLGRVNLKLGKIQVLPKWRILFILIKTFFLFKSRLIGGVRGKSKCFFNFNQFACQEIFCFIKWQSLVKNFLFEILQIHFLDTSLFRRSLPKQCHQFSSLTLRGVHQFESEFLENY